MYFQDYFLLVLAQDIGEGCLERDIYIRRSLSLGTLYHSGYTCGWLNRREVKKDQ